MQWRETLKAGPPARPAQSLTTWVIKHIWMPVGTGTRSDKEVDWMIRFIFGDAHGEKVAARIDMTLGKLPGLEWFDRVKRSRQASLERLGTLMPSLPVVAESD